MSQTHIRTLAAAALVCGTLAAACSAGGYQVSTEAAPNAQLTGLHTFRILPVPSPRGNVTLGPNDPMLDNSITNQALRQDLRNAFESRGYRPGGGTPDFEVAYYASANRQLDIQTWDYGYTWQGWPRGYTTVTPFEQGTVLIDVINPATHQLVWRGQAVAPVSTSPTRYMNELNKAVSAIVKRFPPSSPA